VTPREVAVLASPALAIGLLAVPFGFVYGAVHWAAAAVAVGLCVPAAFGTCWLTKRLAARHPLGGLIGMTVGVAARMLVAVGGGMAVFFGTGAFADAKLGFWFWLLVTYLGTQVAETALLAGPPARPGGEVSGGEG
jgi:hypothetical protein